MLTLETLVDLVERHRQAAQAQVSDFALDGRHFPFNSQPAIMGVINLSPDSWYRESICLTATAAVQRGKILAAQGADIIDLGAESTLNQAARAGAELQTSKLLPVIVGLRAENILVSVETYNASVARAALEAGANLLNLTGPADASEIYRLCAAYDAAVIICYVQGKNVRAVGDFQFAADPLGDMPDYFARQIDLASQAGLDKILIDPGLGFYYQNLQDSSRRIRHQMAVFLNSFRLRALGRPICHALPHAFELFQDEVRTAEPFFAVLAALGKTDLFRTHEVPKIKAVLDTLKTWGG